MVYKLTGEIDGEITPVTRLIFSSVGETEKLPPAILKKGLKETDASTSIQLLVLVYESVGFAEIDMVKDPVLEHVAGVV